MTDFNTFNLLNTEDSDDSTKSRGSRKDINYNKKYYENNKDKWSVKHVCMVCEGSYSTSTKSRHFKSKKHINASKTVNIFKMDDSIKIELIKNIILSN